MIRFDDVSKRYQRRAASLSGSLAAWLRLGLRGGRSAEFWALRNVTFAVRQGETLGIVGANGAGKSTILKLIAGITAPTSGRIATAGRVGTLIELGAGFVPDLTGRENIFLCGALYGLAPGEMAGQFDRIVAFSGLESFLDVPVKYYSSGMYARLGFSIAIHIRADILLADDVLSVGDTAFQRQCLRRFEELRRSATILFISHDLPKIRQVCDRALWIREGRLAGEGNPDQVVEAYLQSLQEAREGALRNGVSLQGGGARRWGSGEIRLVEVLTCDEKGQQKSVFRPHDAMLVRIAYRVNGAVRDPGFCVSLLSEEDVFLQGTNTFSLNQPVHVKAPEGIIELLYPSLPLSGGTYWILAGATSGNDWAAPYDFWEHAQRIEVLRTGVEGGLVSLEHQWNDQAS